MLIIFITIKFELISTRSHFNNILIIYIHILYTYPFIWEENNDENTLHCYTFYTFITPPRAMNSSNYSKRVTT